MEEKNVVMEQFTQMFSKSWLFECSMYVLFTVHSKRTSKFKAA